jgi:hypothetical protein
VAGAAGAADKANPFRSIIEMVIHNVLRLIFTALQWKPVALIEGVKSAAVSLSLSAWAGRVASLATINPTPASSVPRRFIVISFHRLRRSRPMWKTMQPSWAEVLELSLIFS